MAKDLVKSLRQKVGGAYSVPIPIGADAENVLMANGEDLEVAMQKKAETYHSSKDTTYGPAGVDDEGNPIYGHTKPGQELPKTPVYGTEYPDSSYIGSEDATFARADHMHKLPEKVKNSEFSDNAKKMYVDASVTQGGKDYIIQLVFDENSEVTPSIITEELKTKYKEQLMAIPGMTDEEATARANMINSWDSSKGYMDLSLKLNIHDSQGNVYDMERIADGAINGVHEHDASAIKRGKLAVVRGGTGVSSFGPLDENGNPITTDEFGQPLEFADVVVIGHGQENLTYAEILKSEEEQNSSVNDLKIPTEGAVDKKIEELSEKADLEKAPIMHASEEDKYGLGTEEKYGHNKLIDNESFTDNDEPVEITEGEALAASAGYRMADRIGMTVPLDKDEQGKDKYFSNLTAGLRDLYIKFNNSTGDVPAIITISEDDTHVLEVYYDGAYLEGNYPSDSWTQKKLTLFGVFDNEIDAANNGVKVGTEYVREKIHIKGAIEDSVKETIFGSDYKITEKVYSETHNEEEWNKYK